MIDPAARVADGARIGEGVQIGPYCVVGPQVVLEDGVRLIAQVHVTGVTTIGAGTVVYPFASLGTPPQSVHYRGGATQLVIGPRCELREGVTVNTGTEDGGGVTRIGERCFFMVGSHIGHDCQVGSGVTFANLVTLGGHVSVGNDAFVGGMVAVHQYGRIGEGAMVGGLSAVRGDVIPFAIVRHSRLAGLNVVGLRRRGADKADLQRLRRAYRMLFFGEGVFANRLEAVAREFAADAKICGIVDFIRNGGDRGLMLPAAERDQTGDPVT